MSQGFGNLENIYEDVDYLERVHDDVGARGSFECLFIDGSVK